MKLNNGNLNKRNLDLVLAQKQEKIIKTKDKVHLVYSTKYIIILISKLMPIKKKKTRNKEKETELYLLVRQLKDRKVLEIIILQIQNKSLNK